jgi:hypothetical protein
VKPTGPIKLVGQLLDLPILDSEGSYCGIVDDIEFGGSPGKDAPIKALLVGPGAYAGRLPGWWIWMVTKIAGDRVTRVPIASIDSIDASVKLNVTANAAGLHRTENEVRAWIPRKGAL